MKKPSPVPAKLAIARETVRSLSALTPADLAAVAGGAHKPLRPTVKGGK